MRRANRFRLILALNPRDSPGVEGITLTYSVFEGADLENTKLNLFTLLFVYDEDNLKKRIGENIPFDWASKECEARNSKPSVRTDSCLIKTYPDWGVSNQ